MGEQGVQEEEHPPLWGPRLRISMAEVLLPTFTTWGRTVRNSRTQLDREGFRPRVMSLVMSLKAEL
jgi:hypothetical protein